MESPSAPSMDGVDECALEKNIDFYSALLYLMLHNVLLLFGIIFPNISGRVIIPAKIALLFFIIIIIIIFLYRNFCRILAILALMI